MEMESDIISSKASKVHVGASLLVVVVCLFVCLFVFRGRVLGRLTRGHERP